MQIVWEHGRGSVRDVHEVLRAERPIAYTTVMTVLVRLAEKRLLHQEGNRGVGYLYTPVLTKDELITMAVQEILADLQPTPLQRRRALQSLTTP